MNTKKEWLERLKINGTTFHTNILGEEEGNRLYTDRSERVIIHSEKERKELVESNLRIIKMIGGLT